MNFRQFNAPILFSAFVALLTVESGLASRSSQKTSLDDAIRAVKKEAASKSADITRLSRQGLIDWFKDDWRALEFQKDERRKLDEAFAQGVLPELYSLKFESFPGSQAGPEVQIITLNMGPIPTPDGGRMSDSRTVFLNGQYALGTSFLPSLRKHTPSMDESLYEGTTLSQMQSGEFPSTVNLRVREVELVWGSYKSPALEVEFLVNLSNLEDLAHYFGSAYSSSEVARRLQQALGSAPEKWISIRQILSGWVGDWLNRFPAERYKLEGVYPNDVCHGANRQFFSPVLANGYLDRSTEATAYFLRENYTLLDDSVEPAFGDYLYLPGQHSIRFILKDPASGRWVGFSVWSSESTPYRLWWVDQDYFGPNSGSAPPAADPAFEKKLDVWRRKPDAKAIRF